MSNKSMSKKPASTATPRALIENITTVPFPHELRVNDFPTEALNSMRTDVDHDKIDHFEHPLERFYVIHPYFLKPGENAATVEYRLDPSLVSREDRGPWALRINFARARFVENEARFFDVSTIGSIVGPPLKDEKASQTPRSAAGIFAWKEPLPAWRWTHGVAIENSPATRQSLFQQYEAFHAGLKSLYPPKGAAPSSDSAAFRERTRASIQEFIQASEAYGKPFTYLDELFALCSPPAIGDQPTSAPEKPVEKPHKRMLKAFDPGIQDGMPADVGAPLHLMPDGSLPPPIEVRALPPADKTKLSIFANGRLAELTDGEGRPLLVIDRNYKGGSWGSGNEPLSEASLWFRKNAKNEWELDAVYPMHLATMELMNSPISRLLEIQPY